MTRRLTPIPDALVRTAITLGEAQHRFARGAKSEAQWRSSTPDEQIFAGYRARQYLLLLLINNGLAGYIWAPSNRWYRVPSDYWLTPGMTLDDMIKQAALSDECDAPGYFLDAPLGLEGQPFIVWAEDVDAHLATEVHAARKSAQPACAGSTRDIARRSRDQAVVRASADDQRKEAQRVAQHFDAERTAKRYVNGKLIASVWDYSQGAPLGPDVIKSYMKGQEGGRPSIERETDG